MSSSAHDRGGRGEGSDPEHPILTRACEFDIVGMHLALAPADGGEPFLDLVLKRGAELHVLRFWSPRELEIDKGGPSRTGGLVIRDVRARGWEGIGVQVDDFEASAGAVRFLARSVEELPSQAEG